MAIGFEVTPLSEVGAEALSRFAASLHGEVLQPGHPGYDSARRLYNAMIDKRPGVIVRCADRE
ncbi:MAG: hypothetical protein ACREMG_03230, partial [Gemmatimonadales bacterium]